MITIGPLRHKLRATVDAPRPPPRGLDVGRALELRTGEAGKRLYAARVLLRAWLRCRDQRRFDALKEAWEVEKSTELLMELNDERVEIEEDIEDVRGDLKDQNYLLKETRKRIRELRSFRNEAQLRLPKVEGEIDKLEIEDIEGGWAEASHAWVP